MAARVVAWKVVARELALEVRVHTRAPKAAARALAREVAAQARALVRMGRAVVVAQEADAPTLAPKMAVPALARKVAAFARVPKAAVLGCPTTAAARVFTRGMAVLVPLDRAGPRPLADSGDRGDRQGPGAATRTDRPGRGSGRR